MTGERDPDVTRDGSDAGDGPATADGTADGSGATHGTTGGAGTAAGPAATPEDTASPEDAASPEGSDAPGSPAAPDDSHEPAAPEDSDGPAPTGAADAGGTPAPPEGPAPAATPDRPAGPSGATPTADGDAPTPATGPDTAGRPDADGRGAKPRPSRRRRRLRVLALSAALLLLAAAGTGWWLYQRLDANIRTDTVTAKELERHEAERPVPVVRDARNILLIGSDTRDGKGNGKYGRDSGTQRSDTTILLHLAADGESATAVSIPRDLMVDIPACRSTDGTEGEARLAQFNWAYQYGGAACTIRTVEKLTGIRIDHHMIIDFRGFKRMVDAVDGVEVCLEEPVDDADAHLRLPAGRQTLHGEDALGYVRARYSLGDGSDTSRMTRQQEFLGSLLKKVRSNGVLLNPRRLYPVLDAATSSLTTDPGLGSLRKLYGLTQDIRDIPDDRIQFLTVPRQPYALDRNRDELVQPDADRLFRQLRLDLEVSPAGDHTGEEAGGDGATDGTGSDGGGTPSSSPSTRPEADPSARPPAGGSKESHRSSTDVLVTAAHGICG